MMSVRLGLSLPIPHYFELNIQDLLQDLIQSSIS